MRDILVLTIILGSLPIIFVRPHFGVVMWSWISFMNPHRLAWDYAYDFSVGLPVAIVTVVAWLFSREPKRFSLTPVTVLLLVWTLWTCVTYVFSPTPEIAQPKWERSMKMLFMVFVTMGLMGGRDRIRLLVWVIVISIGFYGIRGGIFTILTGGQWRVMGPADSFIGDNNTLGLAMIMVVPLMRYLQLQSERRWVRLGFWGAMGLTLVAILGTYSRGALVGFVVMLIMLLMKSRRRIFIGLVLGVTTVLGLSFMPNKWSDRMNTIQTFEEDPSVQGRFEAWTFAWEVAKDRPVLGGGFSVFDDDATWARFLPGGHVRNAHSIYFEVLGEHGFPGLVIFLTLGVLALRTTTQIARRTRDKPDLAWARDLAAMSRVALLGYAATGVFINVAMYDLYYTIIALLVLLREHVDAVVAEEGAVERGRAGVAAAYPAPAFPRGRIT
ncbi:MAG: putative O-glycosylation ligase, exosortase A system-associated [Alphaproteobacteria bacterium]